MYTNILVLDNGTEIQANQTGSTITNLVYTATVSTYPRARGGDPLSPPFYRSVKSLSPRTRG